MDKFIDRLLFQSILRLDNSNTHPQVIMFVASMGQQVIVAVLMHHLGQEFWNQNNKVNQSIIVLQ